MNTVKKIKKYITDPEYRFLVKADMGRYNSMPDEAFLKRKFKAKLGYELKLDNPKSFNEKLQWLKLYDQKPLYTTMVDKYAAKDYVAAIIGPEYIIPTLGVWDSFDDIDFQRLPDQFVLKCTHDSGGLVICQDKSKFDVNSAKQKINKSLRTNYYYIGREWPYKDIKPRILAEKYMTDREQLHGLIDYKLHCFNGIPKMILVCKDRFGMMTEDFYSDEWVHIPVTRSSHPNANTPDPKPSELDEMLQLAAKLSANTPFLRVDLYVIHGKVYFGELTLFPASGMERFIPEEFDYQFGDWITIPASEKNDLA